MFYNYGRLADQISAGDIGEAQVQLFIWTKDNQGGQFSFTVDYTSLQSSGQTTGLDNIPVGSDIAYVIVIAPSITHYEYIRLSIKK